MDALIKDGRYHYEFFNNQYRIYRGDITVDHAQTEQEAIALCEKYNADFSQGLIAEWKVARSAVEPYHVRRQRAGRGSAWIGSDGRYKF